MKFKMLAIAAGVLLPLTWATAAPPPVKISLDANELGPVINKNVYGQFAEHLGRGIYEGVWVGEKSAIPNTRGFRNDVIAALKAIHVPLVRWPGGCFADEYHWRDGIGPRDKRPVKVNTHWGGVEETNAFGTHEFFDLVELLGADAYVNGNLGSGTVQEMAEWMEYLTSDTTSTLANERRKNGRDKPWDVAFFAVGNESWGCGGQMRVEYYADLYTHYATFLKAPRDKRPKLIASGFHDEHTNWTEHLSKVVDPRNMAAISHHYYTMPTGEWKVKGKSTGFDESEWIATLAQTLRIEKFIADNIAVLDRNDPDGNIGFYIDEWGTWYDPEPGREPGFLYQQNTLRDALVAAINFNIFHDYPSRIQMTNIAQMVNVLQAMILTENEKMLLTPTYHIFDLYQVFQGAKSVPLKIKTHNYKLGKTSVPAVSASAAQGKDGKWYLALANLDPNNALDIDLQLANLQASEGVGRLLTAATIDAHNTFTDPNNVKPMAVAWPLDEIKLPSKSVAVIELR